MSTLLRPFVFAAALLAGSPAGAVSLDPSFGNGGMVQYGFQPIGGVSNNQDVAIVACAGPSGTLVVAGRASSDRRVVVAWLTESGRLDDRFSVDGKESFDLPAMPIGAVVGLCSSDGKLVMAYDVASPNGEHDIRVLRIDPSTGLPDPTFGNGGTVPIDLDAFAANLGKLEVPHAVNQGANGDILVSGTYRYGAADEHEGGFVIRLTSVGTLGGRFLSNAQQPLQQEFTFAAPHSDGTIWAVGKRNTPFGATAALVRLNATTLDYIDTPHDMLGSRTTVYSGRLLGPDRVALAAAGGPDFLPRLVVIDPFAIDLYNLDAPRLEGQPQRVALAQVVPLSDGDLLYTGTLQNRPGASEPQRGAFYAQRVALGFTKQEREPLVMRVPTSPDCPPALHVWMRTTLWNGRPTLAGTSNVGCTIDDLDYLAMRLTLEAPRPPSVFKNGFEVEPF